MNKMTHKFRQQGGVRTHDYYECIPCKLHVTITQILVDKNYESPIDRFKRWMEAKK